MCVLQEAGRNSIVTGALVWKAKQEFSMEKPRIKAMLLRFCLGDEESHWEQWLES